MNVGDAVRVNSPDSAFHGAAGEVLETGHTFSTDPDHLDWTLVKVAVGYRPCALAPCDPHRVYFNPDELETP